MRRALALVALASLLSGCAIVGAVQRDIMSLAGAGGVTQSELRNRLFEYSSAFDVYVGEAADRISLETTDTRIRRLALLWKIRMPDAANLAASVPDPREAYVESLTLAIAQRQFFEGGAGQTMFGQKQDIAVGAAREIESRAVDIGKSFLKPDQLEELRTSLETLAHDNPIRGEFLREGIQAGLDKAESRGAFNEIFSLPMAPFRALEGVDTGAQAIAEFNVTAQRATDVVADLPQRLRWQLELLTYDLQEQGGALEKALTSFDTLAQSSSRLSSVAEGLPEETRATLEAAGAELELRSATLQKLLAEYRAAVSETSSATTNVTALADALSRTSEQLAQAGVSWNALVTELSTPDSPPPPGTPPKRPFDILDYERTANSITKTAEEVRLLLAEVKTEQAALGSTLGAALVRPLIFAGLVLIAAFFVALLLYRILVSRLAPRH